MRDVLRRAVVRFQADLQTGRWWIETTVGVPPGAPETSTITALDSRTNKIVWQQRHDGADSKGDLTTAGGLLFTGDTGNLVADLQVMVRWR